MLLTDSDFTLLAESIQNFTTDTMPLIAMCIAVPLTFYITQRIIALFPKAR